MQPLRVLLVDDEPAACDNLAALFQTRIAHPVAVVGVAHNTRDAESQIARLQPEVVFLDIEMPRENGLELLKRLQPVSFDVVFATAFGEHAIKALRLNAVDYILKPVDVADLNACVERLAERRRLRGAPGGGGPGPAAFVAQLVHPSGKEHLVVRNSHDYEVLDFEDVLYLEASGSYSDVHYRKGGIRKNTLMSYTLSDYEDVLPPDRFFRIHKSFLVNVHHIGQLRKAGSAAEVLLKDGTVLDVGRRRIPELLRFLKTGQRDTV